MKHYLFAVCILICIKMSAGRFALRLALQPLIPAHTRAVAEIMVAESLVATASTVLAARNLVAYRTTLRVHVYWKFSMISNSMLEVVVA